MIFGIVSISLASVGNPVMRTHTQHTHVQTSKNINSLYTFVLQQFVIPQLNKLNCSK